MCRLKIIGKVFQTKGFGEVMVVERTTPKRVLVKFLTTGSLKEVPLSSVYRGAVQDNFSRTCHGVGYIGNTSTSIASKHKHSYTLWKDMLKRSYGDKFHKTRETYIGCEVSEYFKCYANFEKWCDQQVGAFCKDNKDNFFALDKDILLKGNKTYSEDVCCFVPQEINSIIVTRKRGKSRTCLGVTRKKENGRYVAKANIRNTSKHLGVFDTPEEAFLAYKRAKEAYIKEVADKWKDQIDSRVYEALIGWEVEVTD